MTTGYKIVSLVRAVMIIALGILPMLLLGISFATKAFAACVVVVVVVGVAIHLHTTSMAEKRRGDADRCPYKVEQP